MKGSAPSINCCHCGKETPSMYTNAEVRPHVSIALCPDCMNKAMVGYYASPAYEKVGQATYYKLLERKVSK